MVNRFSISKVDWRLLTVISFFLLSFLGLTVFPEFLAHSRFLIVWILVGLSFFLYDKRQVYGKYLILMNIFLFVNAIGCLANRGQSLISFFRGGEFFILAMINIYFVVLYMRNRIKDFENVLFYLSIIMCVLYIIQYIIYPTPIFRSTEVALDMDIAESSDSRIRIIGQALGTIAYFMGLNKFLCKKEIKSLIQMALGFSSIIILGFRSQAFALVLFSILLFVRFYKFSLKMWLPIIFAAVVVYYIVIPLSFVQNSLENMIERQESGSGSNEARIITMTYYINNFFQNNWEIFLGAGLPGSSGEYADYIDKLKSYHFIYADCGLLGLSWVAGIPVVLIIVIYPIKALLMKVPKPYLYIGLVLAFSLISSIFTREIYRDGNPFIFGGLLALQEKINKRTTKVIV